MKTTIRKIVFTMSILLPGTLMAQWNMVRFDTYTFFNKAFAASPNSVILTGSHGSSNGSFIMRSNNGGTTWDSIFFTGSPYYFNELYFTNVNNGFAGGIRNNYQVLIKTSDNGSNWSLITPDPLSIDPINAISFVDPQHGFAASGTVIYKTIDGGANWTPATPGFNINDISFLDMNIGYACGEANTNSIVMQTNDGGQTWSNLLTTFTNTSMKKLDVVSPSVIFSSLQFYNTLYRTVDGGLSWDTITVPLIYDIEDYDFITANEGHVLSSQGEIYSTSDGGLTWTLEYAVASGAYGPFVFLTSISFADVTGYVCGSSGLVKKYTVNTTGINNIDGTGISFYPNPYSDGNTFSIKGVSGEYQLEIFNEMGQLMVKQNSIHAEGEQITLNNIHLPSGVYTVSLSNNRDRFTGRLVVVK